MSKHIATARGRQNDPKSRTPLVEFQKNRTERVRVSISEFRGYAFIDLRVWYVDESGEYRASNKGMTLRPSLVPQLIQGLLLAARAIDPLGGA